MENQHRCARTEYMFGVDCLSFFMSLDPLITKILFITIFLKPVGSYKLHNCVINHTI